MSSWVEHSGQKVDSVAHLRSVRKVVDGVTGMFWAFDVRPSIDSISGETKVSLLVAPSIDGESSVPPFVPHGLCNPYIVTVPSFPSRTKAQIKAKNKLWPCLFVPKRPTGAEEYDWSPDEIQWVRECMAKVVHAAAEAQNNSDVCLQQGMSVLRH